MFKLAVAFLVSTILFLGIQAAPIQGAVTKLEARGNVGERADGGYEVDGPGLWMVTNRANVESDKDIGNEDVGLWMKAEVRKVPEDTAAWMKSADVGNEDVGLWMKAEVRKVHEEPAGWMVDAARKIPEDTAAWGEAAASKDT